jgi:hypothetical protein
MVAQEVSYAPGGKDGPRRHAQSAFIMAYVNKQEKPMSTSSAIADSSAPSANQTIIRVGLIGVGNWALNGPVRVLSLMPQYEMAAVYSQRRDAAQSAADTFGIKHVVGSIDELVRHPDVDIVLVLRACREHEDERSLRGRPCTASGPWRRTRRPRLNWSTLPQKLVCKPFSAPNAGSRQGCAI